MPRQLFIVFVCFFLMLPAAALAAVYNEIESATLDLSIGHRVDQIDWNIAGNSEGTNPNVLSELTWSDLEIVQLQLDGRMKLTDLFSKDIDLVCIAHTAYGNFITGANRDSDYAGDNRTLEWSRSINQADDGYTADFSGAVGVDFKLLSNALTVTPLIGYAMNIQDLAMTDGVQTVSDDAIHDLYFDPDTENPWPLGIIPALDTSYMSFWYGPWLGLNLQSRPYSKLTLEVSGEFHLVEYFAEADWNLRTGLAHPISFEHEAHGTGLVANLKTTYQLRRNWSLLVSGKLQRWRTGDGVDTTYFADGSRGGTRLNEVKWDSYSAMVGISYAF